jgi:hypothetical protein
VVFKEDEKAGRVQRDKRMEECFQEAEKDLGGKYVNLKRMVTRVEW